MYVCGRNLDHVLEKFSLYKNIRIVDTDPDTQEGEIPTLDFLKKYCDNSTNEVNVLYLHTKGVSWIGNEPTYTFIQDWRNLMLHYNVTKWRDCVTSLDNGHDVAGVNWNTNYEHDHFSGNFWWARSSYIKTLPTFIRPKLINYQSQFNFNNDHCRLDAEFWLGINNPIVKCLHDSQVNHYHSRYPEELYKFL